MNYLAHAFLSPSDDLVLLGNLAADALSPNEKETLHPGVQKGVDLHYLIDEITDRQDSFRQASRLLSQNGIRYAGAVVDLIFDHFLAADWDQISTQTLKGFCSRTYNAVQRNISAAPKRFRRVVPWIIKEDWFGSYRSEQGLTVAIQRLSYRASYDFPINRVIEIAGQQKNFFRESFYTTFSVVRKAAETFLTEY